MALGATHDGLDRDTVFGPVHAVVDARATHGVISVCVPVPMCCLHRGQFYYLPKLIWINVFSCQDAQGEEQRLTVPPSL